VRFAFWQSSRVDFAAKWLSSTDCVTMRAMSGTAEKARALRLQRLQTMLDTRLDHPAAAIEAWSRS
jgi:hypothetical protein